MTEPYRADLPLRRIHPSRWQYRRRFDAAGLLELAQSIQEHGLINRLLVFRHENGYDFEIIAGERRLRALAALALVHLKDARTLDAAVDMMASGGGRALLETMPDVATVSCEVRPGTAADYREIVILENLQREDPTPIEEAEAFNTLMIEEHYTQSQLGRRLGKSQGYISQRLGLLDLADEVRDTVHDEGISFTAARAIATLPKAAQPAVTAHVQDLAKDQADDAATSRKVEAMTRQIRAFLDPHTWEPPAQVISPQIRNRLRLVQHYLQALDPARAGDIAVALRTVPTSQWTTSTFNLTGKRPLTVASDHHLLQTLLRHLEGSGVAMDYWAEAAQARGWTCQQCQFVSQPRPESCIDPLCDQWDGQGVATCQFFIGPFDPVVLPLGRTLVNWAFRSEMEYLSSNGMNYLDSIPAYTQLQERAVQGIADMAREQEQSARQAHLPDLAAYWSAQQDPDDSPFELDHVQAHHCRQCLHHEPGNLSEDNALPPCYFATHPLQLDRYTHDTTRAPGMAVLVQRGGCMVPRCDEFRYREPPAIQPLPHFRFPTERGDRALVLGWFHRLADPGPYGGSRGHALPMTLAWLPYPRDLHDTNVTQLDRLTRYVREHWDELGGDTCIARLISVAITEAESRLGHGKTCDLMNPATGDLETWAVVDWEAFVQGKPPRASNYPPDWPQPWLSEESDE